MRGWRNRQTRWIQVPVPERAWGFNSPLAHSGVPKRRAPDSDESRSPGSVSRCVDQGVGLRDATVAASPFRRACPCEPHHSSGGCRSAGCSSGAKAPGGAPAVGVRCRPRVRPSAHVGVFRGSGRREPGRVRPERAPHPARSAGHGVRRCPAASCLSAAMGRSGSGGDACGRGLAVAAACVRVAGGFAEGLRHRRAAAGAPPHMETSTATAAAHYPIGGNTDPQTPAVAGPHNAGYRTWMRASYVNDSSGDTVNSTTYGVWTYFYFTREHEPAGTGGRAMRGPSACRSPRVGRSKPACGPFGGDVSLWGASHKWRVPDGRCRPGPVDVGPVGEVRRSLRRPPACRRRPATGGPPVRGPPRGPPRRGGSRAGAGRPRCSPRSSGR